MFYEYNARCNAEVIVEVGVGRARWVAVEPWAKPPEAAFDNCIALCWPPPGDTLIGASALL